MLTGALARRCSSLLAVDVSEAALQTARQRLATQPHVRLRRCFLPQEFPRERFDLVVLSEVGCYWSQPVLAAAADEIVDALVPGGTLLLVHWTPPVHVYPLTGDAVHGHFQSLTEPQGPLRHLHHDRQSTYRLDVYERRD